MLNDTSFILLIIILFWIREFWIRANKSESLKSVVHRPWNLMKFNLFPGSDQLHFAGSSRLRPSPEDLENCTEVSEQFEKICQQWCCKVIHNKFNSLMRWCCIESNLSHSVSKVSKGMQLMKIFLPEENWITKNPINIQPLFRWSLINILLNSTFQTIPLIFCSRVGPQELSRTRVECFQESPVFIVHSMSIQTVDFYYCSRINAQSVRAFAVFLCFVRVLKVYVNCRLK